MDGCEGILGHNSDNGAAFAFPFGIWHPWPFPMTESLSDVLRHMRTKSLVQQAEFIRDCCQAECYSFEQRTDEARKLVHAVLYDFALGKITAEERQRILDILQFAKTTCIIRPEEPIATYQDEETVPDEERPKKQQTFMFKP